MSQSNKNEFFNFDTSLDHNMLNEEGVEEPGDDTDYDKLNEETFGDDLLNWEESNDKSPECEKESVDFENNQLSKRVASVILDDEDEDPLKPTRPRPASNQTGDGNKSSKVFTVEEIESEMRRRASMNEDSGARRFEPPADNNITGAANINPSAPHHLHNEAIPNRYPNEMQDVFHHRYPAPYNNMHFPQIPHHQQGLAQRPPGPLPPPQPRMQSPGHPQYVVPPRMRRAYSGNPQYSNQYQLNSHQHPGINQAGYFNQQQPRGYNMPAFSSSQQPLDEYAGLMTPQEKQWLQSIQAMQLSGNQPLQDDYYYVMYNNNKQGNVAKKMGSYNVKNSREVAKPTSTYTPLQFENSLGKLQIGSVTAPRKIIDMDVVESQSFDGHAKPEKKSKQQLIEIEELYNIVLEMEEDVNPLFNPQGLTKKKEDIALQEKIMDALLPDNKLVAVMAVRKGRKLVSRLLPIIANTVPLVNKLLVDLVAITRKDTDQTLLLFSPYVRSYVDTVSLKTLVEITSRWETNFLLSTKFITSVIAKVVERAWQVYENCEEDIVQEDWKQELIRLVEASEHWLEENRPVISIDRDMLTGHLKLIEKNVDGAHMNRLVRALGKTVQAIN